MPSLIQEDSFNLWLDGDPDAAASLQALYPGRDLHVTPANPVMNSAAAEGPECLQAEQGELF